MKPSLRRTVTLAAIGLLAATGPASVAASAPAGPGGDPDVKIVDVVMNGTGCSEDNALVVPSNGGKAIDVLYASFTTQVGNVPQDDGTVVWTPHSKNNCVLTWRLSHRAGYVFQLRQVVNRGTVELAAGATAKQVTTYSMGGQQPMQRELTSEFGGPKRDTYSEADSIGEPGADVCDRQQFTLDTRVRMTADRSVSEELSTLTLEDTSGSSGTKFYLGWKEGCYQRNHPAS